VVRGANGPYVVGNAQRKSKPRKQPAWSSPPIAAAVQTARPSAAATRPPLPTTRPTQSAQSLVHSAHRAHRADSRRLARLNMRASGRVAAGRLAVKVARQHGRRDPRGDRPACALMAGAAARTGASLVAGGTTSATARPRGSPRGPRRSVFHRRRWFEGSVAHLRRQFPRRRQAVR
jgi:hypothetical protein